MKELKGPLLLLCAAFIWGSSFIVMKNAVDFLTPAVLLFVRFSMASLILSFMFFSGRLARSARKPGIPKGVQKPSGKQKTPDFKS